MDSFHFVAAYGSTSAMGALHSQTLAFMSTSSAKLILELASGRAALHHWQVISAYHSARQSTSSASWTDDISGDLWCRGDAPATQFCVTSLCYLRDLTLA